MPQELIALTLAVTGSFHQACNVHEIHVRRHQSFRSHNFTYSCQPGVGYRDFTNVGVDGSERVGGRFHRLPGQGAEKGGFPSVGETYYAYGERQPSLLILRPWYPPRDCLDDIVHHPASLPMTAWMTTQAVIGRLAGWWTISSRQSLGGYQGRRMRRLGWRSPVSYTHLRAHETVLDLVC